jgi:aspartate aminotransferase
MTETFRSKARLEQLSNQLTPGANSNATMSNFSASVVPQAPEDPLFGLMAAYRADTFEKKVDLGIGAYRDDNAKPWVLPVVKKVSGLLFYPEYSRHHLCMFSLLDWLDSCSYRKMMYW